MAQNPPGGRALGSTQSSSSSRRLTLLLLLVVAAGAVLFVILRGTGSSKSAAGHKQQVAIATHSHSKSSGHAKVAHTGKRSTTKRPTTKHPAKPAKKRTLTPDQRMRKQYSGQLLPILDRSRAVFDQAARSTASTYGLGALQGVCGRVGNRVAILQDQIEGVPHPFVWYSPAGTLHHNILGIYHAMAGSALACQTAAGNGESDGAASAVADIAAQDHSIRHMDDYVRWLSWHG
jgi:hypothetical protein